MVHSAHVTVGNAIMKYLFAIIAVFLCVSAVHADMSEDEHAYVAANLTGIFYHELGHAVIDLNEVPIFAQEEDAADVFSVLLIDMLNDEEAAQSIAYDAAFGYIEDPEGLEDISYWDVHGPDEQRFYNHVCLFVGAVPDIRQEFAEDLELPEERLESCADEYDLALESWNPIIEELAEKSSGNAIEIAPDEIENGESHHQLTLSVIEQEVDALNADFALPETLTVRVVACGEANAFYDPDDISITICSEFVDHLIMRMPDS